MELVSVGADGHELGTLKVRALDVDIGKTNDFVMTFSALDWSNDFLSKADHWYADGYGEIGGKIRVVKSATASQSVQLQGPTWRGMLAQKSLNRMPVMIINSSQAMPMTSCGR